MEYIKDEIKHCKAEMRKASGERYSFLYSVQQALQWALDPMSYAAPVETILGDKITAMDIPVGLEDCSDTLHLLPI